ncbi:phosphomevalonate kinase isoform X1 [Pararge aegeria]|uniref:phosphomevalonate kinase isoform X1 n=1 Tax=Pararge aegeria TaxID=116150 RepID=UPI0019CFFC64|nr:phosphomevalonate kinase isoform X1 [Pararge aegeria]XP_039758724.1 phosphomevalonate kinase isoform X1 [Pararge aegeria]
MTGMSPQVILLFSGKRKCGKDFLTNRLKEKFGETCEIIRISEPIKSHWAKENNLNLNELLSDGEYKEFYRLAMIKWSDEMREKDYGCFCRTACGNVILITALVKPIWIVSDIRRTTDIQWFKETYGELVKTIRLTADEDTRIERGFQFKCGVDDVASECGLDNYNEWNLVINNGKGKQSLEEQLSRIAELIPVL